MTDDLKPCPFCGGEINGICKTDYCGGDAYAVSCRYKGCHGTIFTLGYGYFSTKAEAIAAWNTRADADRIEQLERDYKEACNEAAECYMRQCVAERKLAKAVNRLTDMRDNQTGYRHVVHFRRGASVTLAELEGGQ